MWTSQFEIYFCCSLPCIWTHCLPLDLWKMDFTHVFFFPDQEGKKKKKKKPIHTQHAKKAGMTVRENGCWGKKAIVTGNYLNRVKIKKRPTTQSVSRIRAVFSRLANYSVCINFGLFLLSFMFLLFILF